MEEISLNTESLNKKKPNKTVWIIIAVSIISFIACFFIIDTLLTEDKKPKLEVSNTSLSVEYNEYLGYSAKIIGLAKNTTNTNYSYASVEFSVYDSNGNNLGTALANINNLASGDNWNFEANLLGFTTNRPIQYKLVEIITW